MTSAEDRQIATVDTSGDLVERRPSGDRLVVQRTLFAGTSAVADDRLYAVVEGGSERSRYQVDLERGSKVHTNTFFGRFPASYWQRWTAATVVTVTLRVSAVARCRVQLKASDIGRHHRIAASDTVVGDNGITLTAPLSAFIDGGALWLEFQALGGPATISDVEWSVTSPATSRPLAIAMCTYNRADHCAQTVAALASDERVVAALDAVYLVDQGTDLVADRELYQEVSPVLGDKLHYVRQPNLGGAGGFSRGLYEASSDGADTDVILMDDDILCEPETVLRLSAFANMTTAPAIIGAQMLFLYNPTHLLASAEKVDLVTLRRGVTDDEHSQHNANMLGKISERRVDAQYNGWWSCLIPAEVVRSIGMPLPVFFQWDDVEYSLRAGRAGIPTVTLPGAGVWHADFYWKDVDGFAQFFATRNGLITSVLDPGFAPGAVAKELGRDITRSIVSMQYGLAFTQLRALEDFLGGPDVLNDGGVAALASINEGRRRFPETVSQPASALPASVTIRRAPPKPKPGWEDAVLAKRAVAHARGRLIRGPVSITFEDAQWYHVSNFDHIFVTDASQAGVRERRYDHAVAAEMTKRLVQVMKRFRAQSPDVAQSYRDSMPTLTSRENWARLYGL